MRKTVLSFLFTLCAFLLTAGGVMALDPDEAVKARQASFKKFGTAMKSIGALSKGDVDANRTDLIAAVKDLNAVAAEPWPYFTLDTSVTRLEHEAKSTIWADPAGFKAAQDKFYTAAQNLQLIAMKGTRDEIGKAVADLGASCGNCHKQFKK